MQKMSEGLLTSTSSNQHFHRLLRMDAQKFAVEWHFLPMFRGKAADNRRLSKRKQNIIVLALIVSFLHR